MDAGGYYEVCDFAKRPRHTLCPVEVGIRAVICRFTKTGFFTRRHLLYSTEFRSLFANAIDQVFHALIITQNATVISPTGEVDEEKRKALMHTIETYAKWQKVGSRANHAK